MRITIISSTLLLFFLTYSHLPDTAQAQAPVVYGILTDTSDSMKRPFPGTNTPIGLGVLQQLAGKLFATPASGLMPYTSPVGAQNYIRDASWVAFRTLGGARKLDDRVCSIDNYSSLVFSGNGCMLSDHGKIAPPSVLTALSGAVATIAARDRNAFHDHSLLGQGLDNFIRNDVMIPGVGGGGSNSGVKVLFITDGGESCNREGKNTANNPADILDNLLSNALSPNLFYLTIVGFGVSDNRSSDRLQEIIDKARARGVQYAHLIITNPSVFATAQMQLSQAIDDFMWEMQSTRYNPCMSCSPTARQTCDCCYTGNFWRWACPFPQCSPVNWVPEWKCLVNETYQGVDGNWVTVCMDGYWVFCPNPEHSATIYCGDPDHSCAEWVDDHGECRLDPCQYCNGTAGTHGPRANQHYYFDGQPSCPAGVACPGPQHPNAPMANILDTWRRPCIDPGRISRPFPLTIRPEP